MTTIFSLPSPLHPAVVHFPIVLILLGSVVAVAAVFIRRWHLPGTAAALLVLGALGSIVAAQTGKHEGELVGGETPAIESILEQHENWAERTQTAAVIVALLAAGAALATRWPGVTRTLSVLTAASALVATWCVVQTGHYGGQLVYRHGAGVNIAPVGTSTGQSAAENKAHRQHDDD
jgi:uncharacterized membrane protein